MTFLNTHWTWQYGLMLVFVFWTAWRIGVVYTRWWADNFSRGISDSFDFWMRVLWVVLATFTFHQWW